MSKNKEILNREEIVGLKWGELTQQQQAAFEKAADSNMEGDWDLPELNLTVYSVREKTDEEIIEYVSADAEIRPLDEFEENYQTQLEVEI